MRILLIGILISNVFIVSGQTIKEKSFDKMVDNLIAHSVPEKSIEDILNDTISVLLDARALNEYKVSHIKNSHWVGYDDFDLSRVNALSKDQPIIVYCSVGYRSEKIAEKLKSAGFTQVYNLVGGIFDWVNSGYTVMDSLESQTENVHAFSRLWGLWLSRGKKIYD